VVAFSSREVREPDTRLLQAVRVIGSMLGQFLGRQRVEDDCALPRGDERVAEMIG